MVGVKNDGVIQRKKRDNSSEIGKKEMTVESVADAMRIVSETAVELRRKIGAELKIVVKIQRMKLIEKGIGIRIEVKETVTL
jgi:hypothetical protein